jgi:SnoaL-like domain
VVAAFAGKLLAASELGSKPLRRTWVTKDKRKGQGCQARANSKGAAAVEVGYTGLDSARERGDAMEHSEELKDLTMRLYEAEATGDITFIERHYSRQEGAVYIGSDPNEWWEGLEAFVEAMRAQSEAMEGMQIVSGQLQAYREGNVGWSIDRDALFRLPDGTEIPFRNTCVFVQEDGEWKLIHGHTSIGVSNEEFFGEDITASS